MRKRSPCSRWFCGVGTSVFACTVLGACVGNFGTSSSSNGAGDNGGNPPLGAAAASLTCDNGKPSLGGTPLRRLTTTEYVNTVHDLFPGVTLPAVTLTQDASTGHFDNDASLQGPTEALVSAYATNARALATAAVVDINKIVPCQSTDATCAGTFARTFAGKAFRRPLVDAEGQRFDAFFAAQIPKVGFPVAVRMFVEGVLQSGSFLYRPEFEEPEATDGTIKALSAYEMATRTSYFLWQTMPDDQLRQAADQGTITQDATLETEAKRLASDPRAHQAVRDFYRQWLRLDDIKKITCSQSNVSGCTDASSAALLESMLRFIDYIYWEKDGTLSDLVLSTKAFVNDAVAGMYGLPTGQGADFKEVDLDPATRAGLFTQPGLLASLGLGVPVIRRGVFVMNQLLCYNLQKPPEAELAKQMAALPPSVNDGSPASLRKTHAGGTCQGCHKTIDGIGFGLSNYGALGEFRTQDTSGPIDASGVFPDDKGGDVTFNGAVDLMHHLATSEPFHECVSKQWFRFSAGRMDQSDDKCAVKSLAETITSPDLKLRDLLVRIVLSGGFRYRRSLGAGLVRSLL